jgi:hypothetical protein
MRRIDLKVLTWATVVAAVVSALWLAAGGPDPVTTQRLTALPAALMSLIRTGEPGAVGSARNKPPAPSQPRRQE